MCKRTLKSITSSDNNNSVLYLALLCLLYFFITSNYLFPSNNSKYKIDGNEKIFIEISEDGITTLRSFSNPDELEVIKSRYSLSEDLKSGYSLVINDNEVRVTRMSGRKSISLGVPIGINSAGAQNLKAIPGIGDELAVRIINYREANGKFKSLDELDGIEGIGRKKLAVIKKSANLD